MERLLLKMVIAGSLITTLGGMDSWMGGEEEALPYQQPREAAVSIQACCDYSGTFAWAELAFVGPNTLLVPQVELRTLSPEEVEKERERRRAWLKRPKEELVDELVQRQPDEPENVYRFRRWVAERYVEWVQANPDAALRIDPRRARAIRLVALEVKNTTLQPVSSIMLWEGDAPVQKQISRWGGMTLEKDLVNLRGGAVLGPRFVAAWAQAHPLPPPWQSS